MESNHNVSNEDNHEMVVETARILLESGSITNGPKGAQSVDIPMDIYSFIGLPKYPGQQAWIYSASINQFPMFAQLVELVLTYDRKIIQDTDWRMFNWVSNLLVEHKEAIQVMSLEAYNNIMDGFANMLRCNLLCRKHMCITDLWKDAYHFQRKFVDIFIALAGYSSQPGRSTKLLRLVLNALNVNHLAQLKTMLNVDREAWTDWTTEELRTFTNNAIECVESMETPLTLQHLAQRAVNSAMSFKSLRSASSLGLTKPMLEYVLMNNF